jgi:hypothetical protein
MKRFSLSIAVALTCLAPAAVAQTASPPSPLSPAQPGAPEKSLGESLQGAASEAYVSAKMLLNNKDYRGALAKFREAYDISKDPRLLYDMAICERNLRAYARMESLLEQYEREAASSISPQDKALCDDALAAIKSLVGSVSVVVSEDGAAVTLDGESVGTTPLVEPLVIDLGKHTVAVTKPGFETMERVVDVVGGSRVALSLALLPQVHEAHLLVTSDSDATVSIDGRVEGKARFEGALAPGVHEVRVSEAGWLPYTAQVELRDGETRTMQVTLEREHRGTILPWLIGGAAVAAGAIVGGYFLFKSSDTSSALAPGKFGTVTFQ